MSTMRDDAPRAGSDRPTYEEESFESLYEEAPCGYLSTRPDGTIIRVNRTILDLTGYTREQLLYVRKFRDLLTIGGRIFYETHFAPLLAMQGAVSELALEIVRADGTTFPALVNSVLRRDARGNPSAIRTIIFDATDRRSYEQELLSARREAEAAARAKSDFVAMLSHDIRTPLSAMVSMADALQTAHAASDQAEYVRLLKSGSQSLMSLVESVLAGSKLERGKTQLDVQDFDLVALLNETVERLRIKAEEKQLELWATFDERIPGKLRGDPVKLAQVFTNLLGNAIKFTDTGWVGVAVALTHPVAEIVNIAVTIMDTGMGIDPDRTGEIFEEFTQVHEHRGRDYGGAGLGLAITKKLVELHGGTIQVRSRIGGGTIFEVSLPLPAA
jgi:PAS domain S-box-containing protein